MRTTRSDEEDPVLARVREAGESTLDMMTRDLRWGGRGVDRASLSSCMA